MQRQHSVLLASCAPQQGPLLPWRRAAPSRHPPLQSAERGGGRRVSWVTRSAEAGSGTESPRLRITRKRNTLPNAKKTETTPWSNTIHNCQIFVRTVRKKDNNYNSQDRINFNNLYTSIAFLEQFHRTPEYFKLKRKLKDQIIIPVIKIKTERELL